MRPGRPPAALAETCNLNPPTLLLKGLAFGGVHTLTSSSFHHVLCPRFALYFSLLCCNFFSIGAHRFSFLRNLPGFQRRQLDQVFWCPFWASVRWFRPGLEVGLLICINSGRFDVPTAPGPFHGVYNATTFGPACPQQALYSTLTPSAPFSPGDYSVISEDCTSSAASVELQQSDCSQGLTLDVYKPIASKSKTKLPVFVVRLVLRSLLIISLIQFL